MVDLPAEIAVVCVEAGRESGVEGTLNTSGICCDIEEEMVLNQ